MFYEDNEVMQDLYDAVLPEFLMLANYLLTPDVVQRNIDEDIQTEIDNYLENKIGWGHERLIQQFFLIGVNDLIR